MLALGAPALAQDSAESSASDLLIAEGLELRRGGRDVEALRRFERAYELSGAPRALAQIAVAEQALGRWLDAERHLVDAMAAEDPWIAERRPVLEEALAAIRAHLASVEVSASVAGATLLLNGADLGALPLATPARVVAGTLELEVRAGDHHTLRRSIDARGGQLVREHFELSPRAPVVASPRAAPHASGRVEPTPAIESSAREGLLVAGAVLAAVAGLTVVGGLVAMGVREEHARAFASDECLDGDASRYDTCAAHWDDGHAAEDAGVALFVSAAIAATGSAVLLGLGAMEEDGARASWACRPSLGGAACAGRF